MIPQLTEVFRLFETHITNDTELEQAILVLLDWAEENPIPKSSTQPAYMIQKALEKFNKSIGEGSIKQEIYEQILRRFIERIPWKDDAKKLSDDVMRVLYKGKVTIQVGDVRKFDPRALETFDRLNDTEYAEDPADGGSQFPPGATDPENYDWWFENGLIHNAPGKELQATFNDESPGLGNVAGVFLGTKWVETHWEKDHGAKQWGDHWIIQKMLSK